MMNTGTARRGPFLALWGGLVLVFVAALAVSVWLLQTFVLSDAWSRQQIDLTDVAAWPDNPSWPYLDVSDRTSEVCGQDIPCVQAVGNDYLTVLKFPDVPQAQRYAATLGADGHQIDPLVVRFDAPLSPDVREQVSYTLSTINAGSPD